MPNDCWPTVKRLLNDW